jgi:hypothetical protein
MSSRDIREQSRMADILDMLTIGDDARRRVVRLLGEIEASG